jgi:hypothetical protein
MYIYLIHLKPLKSSPLFGNQNLNTYIIKQKSKNLIKIMLNNKFNLKLIYFKYNYVLLLIIKYKGTYLCINMLNIKKLKYSLYSV